MLLTQKTKSHKLLIILLTTSTVVLFWIQFPRLGDEFRVEEDFRTFYWMNKFQDPALFPERSDGYTSVSIFGYDFLFMQNSPGYGLLFFVASFWISPILFSKLIPFFLMPVTLWYLFELGKSIRNQSVGFVLALGFLFFNLASSSSISIAKSVLFFAALLPGWWLALRRRGPAQMRLAVYTWAITTTLEEDYWQEVFDVAGAVCYSVI